MVLLVYETAEVPQNLLKARTETEHLCHRDHDESDTKNRMVSSVAPTFYDDRVSIRKGSKEIKQHYPCWFWQFIAHWLI